MALTFTEERLFDCIEEAGPLLRNHWQAIAHFKQINELRPDYITYRSLDNAGRIVVCTARDSGKLVGYVAFILSHGLHYSEVSCAACDVLWLEPSARRGRAALRLLEFGEIAMRKRGIDIIDYRVKVDHPALGRMLVHLGYEPAETIFVKSLR